jgi:hypothetical protein
MLAPLRDQYGLAIARTTADSVESHRRAHSASRLAEHLMAFFWRYKLELDEKDGLLSKFWENAPNKVRADALSALGQWCRDEQTIERPVAERLKTLRERRLAVGERLSLLKT